MVIESKAPSILSENEKPKAQDFEKAMEKNSEYSKGDKVIETSKEHVLVNLEPIREELVQMAVKFLSHATVRSSPVLSRRSFLEKKGLTKEEIDEAFHRVPDPPTNVTSGQNLTSSQYVQSKSFTKIQPHATVLATSPPSQFCWSHAFSVVGLLAASGAGAVILLKNFIFPRLKSWICKVVLEEHDGSAKKSKPSLFEEVTAAAKTASTQVANVAKASMEMLNSEKKEKQYFEALKKRLEIDVAEVRSMSNAIQKLEGTRGAASSSNKQAQKYVHYATGNGPNNTPPKSPVFNNNDPASPLVSSMKVKESGVSNFDGSVRPSLAPASMGPTVAQHPKSYIEIMSMIQRGEIPPGIKEINDSPPNPDQPLPTPGMAPRTKPWEVSQPSNIGTYAQDKVSTSQLNVDRVLPWWHYKNVRSTESKPGNGMRTNMYDVMNDEWPVQSWVPPQSFSVAMPKAADAIRLS